VAHSGSDDYSKLDRKQIFKSDLVIKFEHDTMNLISTEYSATLDSSTRRGSRMWMTSSIHQHDVFPPLLVSKQFLKHEPSHYLRA
jgi:hypothetical protein